jgi:UDP-glucose 4-epimerase
VLLPGSRRLPAELINTTPYDVAMRAIVTGGAGFIGSHLVDSLLEGGNEVHVVDDLSTGRRENLAGDAVLHELDIRDEAIVPLAKEVQPELIFHLGAQSDVGTSVARPAFDADVNVVGTVRVIEAARAVGARVIFTSTGGAIYGECVRPAREDDERRPASPYAASKLSGEEYLATWNRLHETAHVVCRLANVYGPRQQPKLEGGVVAVFFDRLRDGRETEIFGDGEQTRDFVFVGDVVEALLAATSAPAAGLFNVGSGVETNVLELHRLCGVVAGREQQPRLSPARPGDLRNSVLDPGLARRQLGWQAKTPLVDGLARTWDSVRIA